MARDGMVGEKRGWEERVGEGIVGYGISGGKWRRWDARVR